MRQHKTLELDAGRLVVLRELRVADVRRLLVQLQGRDWQALSVTDLADALPELLTLAGDSLTLPPGETLDDLSLSECEAIGRAWWELHRSFFAPLAALAQTRGGATPATPAPPTPATSTAPA